MQALIKHSVTHLSAVPSLLQALVPYLQACPPARFHQAAATATSPDMLEVSPGKHHMALDRDLGTDSMHTQTDSNSPYGQTSTGVSLSTGATAENRLALRALISSGEPLSIALAQALRQCLPDCCSLLNLYGSTELAADCTCLHIPPVLSNSSSQLPSLSAKGVDIQGTNSLSQGFRGVYDVSASAPVPQQHKQGLEPVSNPASRSAPTAAVATPGLQPAHDQDAARAQGTVHPNGLGRVLGCIKNAAEEPRHMLALHNVPASITSCTWQSQCGVYVCGFLHLCQPHIIL